PRFPTRRSSDLELGEVGGGGHLCQPVELIAGENRLVALGLVPRVLPESDGSDHGGGERDGRTGSQDGGGELHRSTILSQGGVVAGRPTGGELGGRVFTRPPRGRRSGLHRRSCLACSGGALP